MHGSGPLPAATKGKRATKTWRCPNRGCKATVRGTSDEATVDAVLQMIAEGHAERCEHAEGAP